MTRNRIPSGPWRTLLLVAICATLGGVLLGVGLATRTHQPPSGAADSPAPFVPEAHPPARVRPGLVVRPRAVLLPVRLEIPAIEVTTRLVRLGLMPDGTVAVPDDPDLAGWFQPGSTPGRRGSAVILGHVDSVQGPAVFARLQELQPGDVVTIGRADGSMARFVVRKAVLYDNDEFPARRVYAADAGRHLNLVTCGGSYDSTRGGYQSNLVVYTRFVQAAVDSSPSSVTTAR